MARALAESLGLAFLTLLLLASPVRAEDSWRPLLVDGERLPGPGVWTREGRRFYPLVLLGRRLRSTVGINRVGGVVVVDGREIPTEMIPRDGVVFVPEASVRKAFVDLLLEEDGLAVQAWTSSDHRNRDARRPGELAVMGADARLRDGRLVLDLEVGNRGPRVATGGAAVVTMLESDGKTYAVFRRSLPPVNPGDRHALEIPLWLTTVREVQGDRVDIDLHGFEGEASRRCSLKWRVTLEEGPKER